MAFTRTTEILQNSHNRAVFKFTATSSTTENESAVTKINFGSGGNFSDWSAGAYIKISKIFTILNTEWSDLTIQWAGATPGHIALFGYGQSLIDYQSQFNTLISDTSITPSSLITFTTSGFSPQSTYNVIIECKKYGFNG